MNAAVDLTERFALYRTEHQQWLSSLALYSDQESYFEALLGSLCNEASDYEIISRSAAFRQWFAELREQMTQLIDLINEEERASRSGIIDWQLRQEIDERHRKMRCGYQLLERQFINIRQNFYAFITPYVH